MKKELLNEIRSIKAMMGLLNEDQEMASQASDLSKVQNLAKLEGLEVDVKKYLDKTNPICEPPKTGNEENDMTLKKVWEWSSNPENKNKLKELLKKTKEYYVEIKKSNSSNDGQSLVVGNLSIPSNVILSSGIFILVILILFSTPIKTNCKKWSKVDGMS